MIQRRVSREVTSMNCGREPGAERVGQGALLTAPRSAYSTPATHRRCTLLTLTLGSSTRKPYRRAKLLCAGKLGKKFVKLVKTGPEQCRRGQRHDPSHDDVAGHVPTHGGGLAGGTYADNGARDRVGRRDGDTEVRDQKQRHCTAGLGTEALHGMQPGDSRAHR